MIGLAVLKRRPGFASALDHFGFEVDNVDVILERLKEKYPKIDTKLGRLRWINNSGSSSDAAFELEYQTRAGQVQMETLTMSFIRDASVRMYQRRTDLTDPVNLVTRKR